MSKKLSIIVLSVIAISFSAAALFAGTTVKDTFEMKSPEYKKHTYNTVTLTHKKHVEEYKVKCGDCHHNEKGEPLTNLKMGDNVQRCIECHKKPSRKPKRKKGEPKLTDKQKREYHAEALHDNCKDCHKAHNKKVKKETGKKGSAPTSCNKCHPGGKTK